MDLPIVEVLPVINIFNYFKQVRSTFFAPEYDLYALTFCNNNKMIVEKKI